jgi:hypothetical protein
MLGNKALLTTSLIDLKESALPPIPPPPPERESAIRHRMTPNQYMAVCVFQLMEAGGWWWKEGCVRVFTSFFIYFFAGFECVGHSFTYVAHL